MRSIALAMAWEYWRRNLWLTLIFIVLGAAILVFPFGHMLPYGGAFIPLLFAMIGQVVLAINNIRKDRLEFPQELYTKPVSTSTLVALRMALAITAAMGMYLGQVLLIWAASGVILPLWWGPLLALVMAAAWTHAVIWSLPGLALLQVIGLYLAIFSSVSYYGRYIANLIEFGGDLSWQDPSRVAVGQHAVVVVALTGLAYAVAVVGVRFDRRGDRISLARLVSWISDRIYAMRRTDDRPFRSARAAQFWLEWHQHKGWLLPILNALSFAVYAMLAVWVRDVTLDDGLAFLWGLALVNVIAYPVLIAIVVNTRERGVSQDLFWGTRPVSDNSLLWIRLRVAISSLLVSWGVWLAGAIVISGLLYSTGNPEGLINDVKTFIGGPEYMRYMAHPLRFLSLRAGLAVLAMWTALAIVGSLHMTGRKVAAALWMIPLWVYPLWMILVRQDLIADPIIILVQAVTPWAIGILCLVSTGLVYWVALRKGRISRWLGVTVLGIYIIAFYPYPDGWAQVWIDQDPGAVVLHAGLRALFLLPLVLGPLAITWNRHR